MKFSMHKCLVDYAVLSSNSILKPLAQFVFKVSAFRFNTCTKTRAPLLYQ